MASDVHALRVGRFSTTPPRRRPACCPILLAAARPTSSDTPVVRTLHIPQVGMFDTGRPALVADTDPIAG